MNGRFIVSVIVICAALAGAAMFYLQIYGFYDDVSETDNRVVLTSVVTGAPEEIPVSSLSAIDADSSPIRYRACFQTDQSIGMLTESFELHPKAEPRVAPGWFECFEAEQIGMTSQTEMRWHSGGNVISNTGSTELLQFMLMDVDTSGTK